MATAIDATDIPPRPSSGRHALITRPLMIRFVSIIGASISFNLPLAVVPIYAKSAGSDASAGFATGALLLATVLAEFMTPRLVARAGYRRALIVGLVLLGAPALVLLGRSSVSLVLVVSIVRGAGFAIVTVAGGAMTASMVPAARRGEGLALTGVVSGTPALLTLPLGVWASARWGFGPVFIGTAAAALLAAASVVWLSEPKAEAGGARKVCSLLRPDIVRPAALFATSAMAAGVLVTFLPLANLSTSAAVATIALFAQPAASTAARLVAGRFGDRNDHTQLLRPGVLLCAAGIAALAATGLPALIISGAAVFGAGFGLLQNATLAVMYARTDSRGYSGISAIWNAAYDGGMGTGAIAMGLLSDHIGYSAVFLLTAGLVLPALIPAVHEGRRKR